MDLQRVVHSAFRGVYDSFRGMATVIYLDKDMNERMLAKLSPSRSTTPIRRRESELIKTSNVPSRPLKNHEQSKVLQRTFQCCALNGGIFLTSILLFEYGLLPLISFILEMIFGEGSFMRHFLWSWIKPILSLLFEAIWVMPLFLMTKVVNSLWFQDIADSVFRYSRGRPQFMQSISKLLADSIFSIVVQTLFLIQAMLVNIIPLYMIGYVFSIIHMSLLYSLYAFEYKWFNMGWELHKRLTYVENNWPYFIGFGLPLAIFTQLSNSWIISGCIFSILFPLFIISANEASPVTGVCNIPLHLFSPVITLSNALLNTTIRDSNIKKARVQPISPASTR